MKFDYDKIDPPRNILHKELDHFLCYVRQKPIQALPEEVLRQKVVWFLHQILQFPIEHIAIEVPLSYFEKGLKGRADIIVYDKPLDENPSPIILLECKAFGIPLDFRCDQQLERYNKVVNAKYGGLLNGKEFRVYNYETNKEILRLPTFHELIIGRVIKERKVKGEEWNRTVYRSLLKPFIFKKFVDKNIISPQTPKTLTPILVKLIDLIYYTEDKLMQPLNFNKFSIVEDCGLRFADYGFANSNGLLGNYRFFLIKYPDGNHQVVSLSIYHQNDWGTYLMVGVDNRKGHSLELKLDKFISGDRNNFKIIHDGSLTIGKRGRLKNKDVINYINSNASFLIQNDSIFLGQLSAKHDLDFNQNDVKNFLYRICSYAILRDNLRRELSNDDPLNDRRVIR